MLLPLGLILAPLLVDRPLPDFELQSTDGASVRFITASPAPITVFVFLSTECPLAKLAVPRLTALARRFPEVPFFAVNCNGYEDLPSLARFAREHGLTFPFLKDPDGRVAELFGAKCSPHVFVLDASRRIRYRGRIDDQYGRGGNNRGQPTREDLAEALLDLRSGKSVSIPITKPTGCLFHYSKPTISNDVNYSRDIAPIISSKCVECHRPGEVAPFSLLSFSDVRDHAETIVEVVNQGAMPPWHAAPEHG
ncbi:MAG TPA: redoxin domain-containing protein, partial [Urbifossiella sp.]